VIRTERRRRHSGGDKGVASTPPPPRKPGESTWYNDPDNVLYEAGANGLGGGSRS